MNFQGTGRRLQQGDVGDAARAIGLPTAAILAWIEVEANGRGFDNSNRPKILPERHVFYRELGAGSARNTAINRNLAYRKWGAMPYPRSSDDRYTLLNRMMNVSKADALESTSWGLPQILGNNHEAAGFASAEQMVRAMMQGEREQLLAMVTLMKDWGIADTLKGKDLTKAESWRPAARRYNGPSYAKNNYHINAARAFRKHSAGVAMGLPADNVRLLHNGIKGERVRNLQADLKALGWDVGPIDGRFGDDTEAAVRAFQTQHQIKVDGKVGAQTLARIKAALELQVAEPPISEPEWDRGDGLWSAVLRALVSLLGRFKAFPAQS